LDGAMSAGGGRVQNGNVIARFSPNKDFFPGQRKALALARAAQRVKPSRLLRPMRHPGVFLHDT
jgi:hypothetical protein